MTEHAIIERSIMGKDPMLMFQIPDQARMVTYNLGIIVIILAGMYIIYNLIEMAWARHKIEKLRDYKNTLYKHRIEYNRTKGITTPSLLDDEDRFDDQGVPLQYIEDATRLTSKRRYDSDMIDRRRRELNAQHKKETKKAMDSIDILKTY